MTKPIPIRDFERQQKQGPAPIANENGGQSLREYTDESLALQFAERHSGKLRYVALWGKWLHWTGQRWQSDETLLAFDLAREICRQASASCKKKNTADALASAKTVAAIERLARADRRLAATAEQWDPDPWLLNPPGGVIELRAGKVASS